MCWMHSNWWRQEMLRVLSLMCHCQNSIEVNKIVWYKVLSVVLLKIKVFWDRWVKSDPVCLNSWPCVLELLTLFAWTPDPVCLNSWPCLLELLTLFAWTPDPVCLNSWPCLLELLHTWPVVLCLAFHCRCFLCICYWLCVQWVAVDSLQMSVNFGILKT